METLRPEAPEQLAESLASAASAKKSVTLGGAFTKDYMGGPVTASDVRITTTGLNRIVQYEPRDLTISVEAGLPYAELVRVLEKNRQMIPLDPPFSARATVGGVLSSNSCGPRRRLYGTARDFVIGMKFATLDGKLVQSGGMVVKNVAGLDMGKLMIGSFGTLAAIAVANFKLVPKTAYSRTFVLGFESLDEACRARDGILRGVLQPAAIDLLNPQASAIIGHSGHLLILQAGGNRAVIERYATELGSPRSLEGEEERTLWRKIENFTPDFLAGQPDGAVVRVSGTLSQIREMVSAVDGPAVARAGSGVCYAYFAACGQAAEWIKDTVQRGWKAVIEYAPPEKKERLDLWPSPGSDFEMMKRIKEMFDPGYLLNRGRLYGRL